MAQNIKNKISFFETEDNEKIYLSKSLKNYDAKFFKEKLSEKSIPKIKDTEILVVFIYSKVTKEIIDQLPKLKCICTRSTGFDHIDVKYANSKNIPVCTVPFYGDNTVAEHAFALALALSRKIIPSVERTKKLNFHYEGLVGFDLKGKNIGLVGTGRISAYAAKIAQGFGMNILGYDVFQNPDLVKDYNLKYVELDYLLRNSDVVSLHVPLNAHTKHIINSKNIVLMKSNAIIINTARGGLIETECLYNALKNKKIAGAGLDVLEEEKEISDKNNKVSQFNKKLLAMENVLVTPHNAFNSTEALQRIMDTTIENIKAYLAGKPQNPAPVMK
ncbi:MAG TPA: NAD(P)-dependent oxidoreductase [Alphaproteobacteria bacterium]|nr:NAD(P)-dependent oxidoreductase [Alphaproteobacteria bacterium]